MKKLFTIIILFCSGGIAHAEYTDIVKAYEMLERARVSLSACAVELTKLDKLTTSADVKPSTMTAKELKARLAEGDTEYYKGAGLAECLTNMDTLIEVVEENMLKVMAEDIETCTLYFVDFDNDTNQNGGTHYEADYQEIEEFYYEIETENGPGAGLEMCLTYTKQGLDWLFLQYHDVD